MEKEVKLLEVVDGETLMDMQFPKSRFCIQSLLPQGVSILGGAPKIGKSWMVLDWCVRIAKGESVWNLPTEKGIVDYAMKHSRDKEEFIYLLERLGVTVNWQENRKYITFTTDDKHKCRDNKLFDERLLKENLEIYFELGGCDSIISDEYQEYETPQTGIISDDLFNLIGNLFDLEMQNNSKRKWMPHHSKKEIEKLIAQGQKITNEDYDNEYDEYHGIGMSM